MKTTSKTKNTSDSNSRSSKPFFIKSEEGTFFSNSKEIEPFFTPTPVQTKLTIGQLGDKYEQEADTMTEKVVQRLQDTKPFSPIQTKCESCVEEEKIQEKELKEDSLMRRSIFESNGEPPEDSILTKPYLPNLQLSSDLDSNLRNSKVKSNSLSKHIRSNMESAYGADVSDVRIHADSKADKKNQELGAKAFTSGSDIYSREGNYNENSIEGKKLLAHELTHVIQQNSKTAPVPNVQMNRPTTRRSPRFPTLEGDESDENVQSFMERYRRMINPPPTTMGRIIGNHLHYRGEIYRLRNHPGLEAIETVSSTLREGLFLLQPINRAQLGGAALAPGGGYTILKVDTRGQLYETGLGVVTHGLELIPDGILIYTTRVRHVAPEEVRGRQPRDTESLTRRVLQVMDEPGGVDLNPGIVAMIILQILEPQDLTNEELMDILQRLDQRGRLSELLNLVGVQRFRNYLRDSGISWNFIFMNWEARINDSLAIFSGVLVGAGENLADVLRLISILIGSPFSAELARERDAFFAGISQFFAHPVMTTSQGLQLLKQTFLEKLWNLQLFDAGRIIGNAAVTILTLPSAIRSLPRAARAIAGATTRLAALTIRAIRAAGVSMRELFDFLIRPRPQMVTTQGIRLMVEGDDLLVFSENGQPLGRASRSQLLTQAASRTSGSRENPFSGLSDAEIDDMLRQWESELEAGAARASRTGRTGGQVSLVISVSELENIVSAAIHQLRRQLGSEWLPPRQFGTRLHSVVEQILNQRFQSTRGLSIAAEQSIDHFAHVSQRIRNMTIRQFLQETPVLGIYESELSSIFRSLDQRIGNLRPDLVIRTQNQLIVWDLTARSSAAHLAKTMFYSHLLQDGGRLAHIGETYWRHFAPGFDPAAFYGAASSAVQAGRSEE